MFMDEAANWWHQIPVETQQQLRMHARLELTGHILTDRRPRRTRRRGPGSPSVSLLRDGTSPMRRRTSSRSGRADPHRTVINVVGRRGNARDHVPATTHLMTALTGSGHWSNDSRLTRGGITSPTRPARTGKTWPTRSMATGGLGPHPEGSAKPLKSTAPTPTPVSGNTNPGGAPSTASTRHTPPNSPAAQPSNSSTGYSPPSSLPPPNTNRRHWCRRRDLNNPRAAPHMVSPNGAHRRRPSRDFAQSLRPVTPARSSVQRTRGAVNAS